MPLKEQDKTFIKEQVDRIVKALDKLTKAAEEPRKPKERIGPM